MINDFHTEILGDCFVHNLQIDFIGKQTRLVFGGHPDYASAEKHELEFRNVVWQEFNEFGSYNILWGMEVADTFDDFVSRYKDYLQRMKGYFPPGLLESMERNKELRYYFIIPTAGVGGFIVCHEAVLQTI